MNVNGHKGNYICCICETKFTEYNSKCKKCGAPDTLYKQEKWDAIRANE